MILRPLPIYAPPELDDMQRCTACDKDTAPESLKECTDCGKSFCCHIKPCGYEDEETICDELICDDCRADNGEYCSRCQDDTALIVMDDQGGASALPETNSERLNNL